MFTLIIDLKTSKSAVASELQCEGLQEALDAYWQVWKDAMEGASRYVSHSYVTDQSGLEVWTFPEGDDKLARLR